MPGVYETFYELTADPFRLSPDHRFSFGHPSYKKAKAYMQYALERGEGFIMVTGAPGTGKTTLINDMLSQIDETRVTVVSLLSTRLRPDDMLHMVATTLGLQCDESRKSALLVKIKEALTQQHRMQRRVVLMVDEAQDLSANVLEELRLLSNMQLGSQLLLQVFLVGQEPLVKLVKRHDMEHLRQRIIAATHLDPLSIEDTAAFIIYRLKRAGWHDDPVITSHALESIYDFSGGIPRRINLICSRLLFFGAVEEKHRLDQSDVETVIDGMQQEMLFVEERPPRRQRPSTDHADQQPAPEQKSGAVPAAVRQAMAGPVAFAVPDKAVEQPDPGTPLSTFFNVGAAPVESGEAERRHEPEPGLGRQDGDESEGDWTYRSGSTESVDDALPWDAELPPDLDPDAGDLTRAGEDVRAASDGLSADLLAEVNQPQEDSDESSVPGEERATKRKRKPGGGLLMVLLLAAGLVSFLYISQRPASDDTGDWWPRLTAWLEQRGASFLLPVRRDESLDVATTEQDSVERVPTSSAEKPRLAGWIEGDSGTSADHPTASHAGESPAKSPALVAGPEELTAEPSGAGGPVAVPAEASLDATAAQTAMADAEAAPATPSQEAGATQALPADQPIEDRVGAAGDAAVAMIEGPAESGPGIAFNAVELDQSLPRPGPEAAANSQMSVSVEAPEGADASVAINPADRPDAGAPAAEPVEKGVASVQWSSGEGAAQVEARIEPRAAVVTPRSHRAPQNEFDILTYAPEVGTGAAAEDMAALAMDSTAVSLQGRQKSRYETGEIKAQLMSGGWSVFGKPAVLLPSVINHCEDEGTQILCRTAPQDIDAGAKNLVFQAEATLDSFSRRGTFRVRYRIMETSMPLSETDLPQGKQVRVSPGGTALERETTCHIIHSSLIRCQGGAEGVFSYRRI